MNVAIEQQNVHKYAFFMAKWKFKIYQKFVRELQQRDQVLKMDPVET